MSVQLTTKPKFDKMLFHVILVLIQIQKNATIFLILR